MFKDGDTILLKPFRAKAFPVIKDLVDRSAFDRIQQAGGFVSSTPQEIRLMQMRFQSKHDADRALMQQLVLV
jgi:succinate dehydrogenase / fumarate reductase iron-sulfur subunit